VWPAFVWAVLSDDMIASHCGVEVWSYVPLKWRHWWIDDFRMLRGWGERICMEVPKPVFDEITDTRSALLRSLNALRLGDLMHHVNQYLFPTIMCPWGCSEFPHKVELLPMDVVFFRYLGPGVRMVTKDANRTIRLKGSRDDYVDCIREIHLLMNPAWKVMPSIAFDSVKGPSVLVCRNHKGGSILDYIHVPSHPITMLPARFPDQLAPAVMQSRVIQPMRVKTYSTSFQMHEMRGSFAGLDTLSLGRFRRFDFRSLLTLETESVALRCRKDVRGLLMRLLHTGKIPAFLVADMLDASRNMFDDERFSPMRFGGATYLTYVDAIRLKKLRSRRNEIVVQKVDAETGEVTQDNVSFHPWWPSYVAHVHNFTRYGGRFPAVPSLLRKAGDLRTLWYLVSVLVMLPDMWAMANDALSTDRQWMGWVLAFAANTCYSTKTCFGSKSSPYTVLKAEEIFEKLGHLGGFCVTNLVSLFSLIPRLCIISGHQLRRRNFGERLENINIVMVFRMRSEGVVEFDDELDAGPGSTGIWQLRFVGMTLDGTPQAPHKWKGKLFARHGGDDLVGWWSQDREWQVCWPLECDFPDVVYANWDILVYCRKQNPDLDELRDAYLEHLGGQTKVYCRLHNTPMIPSVKMRGLFKTCSVVEEDEIQCTVKAHLCCAFDNCSAAACTHHSKCGADDGSTVYINPIADRSYVDGVEVVMQYNAEEILENDHVPLGDDEDGGEEEELGSYDEQMYVTHNIVDDDEFSLELSDHDDRSLGDGFLTTNAGRTAYDVVSGSGIVPGHVILNNCGSCLIRRNYQLKGTRYQQAFLQQIVSTTKGHAVPLVFPEAMVLPSIFWRDTTDGSLVGALPAAVMASKNECRVFGIASMEEHIKSRLTNPSLRCSTDPRYIFYAYDCVANINLRGEDARIILSRGFAEKQGRGGLQANRSHDFNTDSVDSRPVVNRLAAAMGEKNFTYFFTQTVNQSGFFGMKPMKDWIDSEEFKMLLFEGRQNLTFEEKEELLRAGKESSCIPFVRQWMEVSEIFMTYIAKSDELPLGKVENIWWRHEYQSAKANLSHIHALIRLADSEGEAVILDRIRGMIGDLIRPEEAEQLIAEGVLKDMNDYLETREMARRVLKHSCSERCLKRTGPGENDLRCRAISSRLDSVDPSRHCMQTINVFHSPEAIKVMAELGLCEPYDESGLFLPFDARLQTERHHPPTSAGEGIISPSTSRLFAATKSQSNLQYCTTYSTSRYCTKYAAGIDEHNRVYIGVMTDRADNGFSVRMDSHFMHNTKVSGSAINEKRIHENRRNKHHPTGRGLAVTEAASQLLGYPQVYTDLAFVDVPTVPMEDRVGYDRVKPIHSFSDALEHGVAGPEDVSSNVIAAYMVRNQILNLPEWRKISRSQELLLKDLLFCPVSVDKITVFGIRPPELEFVGHVGKYFRWFEREPAVVHQDAELLHSVMVNYDVMKTGWVDGLNCRVRVRLQAIPEILEYLNDAQRRERTPRVVCRLFMKLGECLRSNAVELPHRYGTNNDFETMRNLFFAVGHDTRLPIPVYSNIKPTQPHRFLIHVLLSMGDFSNELELWEQGSIKEAFVKARLIRDVNLEETIRSLVRRYVMEQLLFTPGGTQMFDQLCVAAHSVLTSALHLGELPIHEMPSVLYTSLRQETTEQVERAIQVRRETLARVCVSAVGCVGALINLPSAEDLAVCTKQRPFPHEITFTRPERQSMESFEEQTACFQSCTEAIDKYLQATSTFTKCRAIAGSPGCGKTFVMIVLAVQSMAMGLCVMIVCLLAKRADLLGGIHVHAFFAIPVHERASVQRLAELAVINLYKNPAKLAFLQRLDVLCFDELGQAAAELVSCIDLIFRMVRKSDQFFGGVLLIATIDPVQLKPIKGRPFLVSPFVLTCFRFSSLRHSVRAADDAFFQRIQDISRMLTHLYTPGILVEMTELLLTHCTFVDSWSDPRITDTMLRCFGRNAAIRHEAKRFMNEVVASGRRVLYREADDYELSTLSHSHWQLASPAVSRALTKEVKEPKVLPFFDMAVYEMTYNKPNHFTQSQIAVLSEMPTTAVLDAFEDIRVMLAPVGCKSVPEGITCPEDLSEYGWRLERVGLAPERIHAVTMGKKGKRQQYGLRHRVCSTIHSVMGSSLGHLVTKLSLTDPLYRLWEKEQMVVLLSRTEYARDIIFVGDPTETVDAILQVMQIRSQYSEYMNHVIDVLSDDGISCNRTREVPALHQSLHPFCPLDVVQPNDPSGCCYILVSLKNRGVTYIGQTKRLVQRIKEHNSGYGSQGTSDYRLRPWALLAYVSGFDGNVGAMLAFERQWKATRDHYRLTDPMQIADVGRSLIGTWQESNRGGTELRYIATGTIGVLNSHGQEMET
jgi:predicted GIY-YIG superfamily endonuclease